MRQMRRVRHHTSSNYSAKRKYEIDQTGDIYNIMRYRYTHTPFTSIYRLPFSTHLLDRDNSERIVFGIDLLFSYIYDSFRFLRNEHRNITLPSYPLIDAYDFDQRTVLCKSSIESIYALYYVALSNYGLWGTYCTNLANPEYHLNPITVPHWDELQILFERYSPMIISLENGIVPKNDIERMSLTLAFVALDVPLIEDCRIYKFADKVLHEYHHRVYKLRSGWSSRGELGFIRCLRRYNFIYRVQYEDIWDDKFVSELA